MKTCPDCNKEHDTEGPACPDCSPPGTPSKAGIVAATLIGLAIAGMVSGGLYWRRLSATPPEDAETMPAASMVTDELRLQEVVGQGKGAPGAPGGEMTYGAKARPSRELNAIDAKLDRLETSTIGAPEPDWAERYRIREQEAASKYRMPPLDTPITVTMKKGDTLNGVLKEVHNDGIFLKTGPAEISVARDQLHMKSRALLYEDDYCRQYAESWVAREKQAYAARMAE